MQQIIFNPEIRKLEDIQTIERQLTNLRSQTGYSGWVLFRGQADADWAITPSIARAGHTPEELTNLEQQLVNEFAERLQAAGLSLNWQEAFTSGVYHNEWLRLQQAQHYRMPTRLLDWTFKANIALGFAVLESKFDDKPGALFMFLADPGEPWEAEGPKNYLNSDPYNFVRPSDFAVISPGVFYDENINEKIAEKRLAKQGGKFILRDYADVAIDLCKHPALQQRLLKFTIPIEAKPALREELKKSAGVTMETIYHVEHDEINKIVKDIRDRYRV